MLYLSRTEPAENSASGMHIIEEFERYRPLLFSIAYRMLGSVHDAEDILQDAYLRYQAVDAETVESLKALLTTIVTRLCLNLLASSSVRAHSPTSSPLLAKTTPSVVPQEVVPIIAILGIS